MRVRREQDLTSPLCGRGLVQAESADKEVRDPEGVKWFHEEAYREASPHADVAVEEWLPLP